MHKGETKHSVKVGNCIIEQESTTKLLGMTIDDNQKWKNHVIGKGGLVTSLNQRLFAIKRLKNHLPSRQVRSVAESLRTSKLNSYRWQILAPKFVLESIIWTSIGYKKVQIYLN